MLFLFLSKKFHIVSCSRGCIIFILYLIGMKEVILFTKFFFKLKENCSALKFTQTGVIQIYKKDRVYLVPTISSSVESLSNNYKFWHRNRFKYSFLQYKMSYHQIENNEYYTIDLMREVDFEFRLSDLDVNTVIEEFFFKGIELEIEQAKRFLIKLPGINSKFVNDFFKIKERFKEVGFLHGDLHIGNVMMNNGQPMLIDLDRAKVSGPIDIDFIHYDLVQLQRDSRVFWLDEIERYFKCSVNSYLASYSEDVVKLYLLYRVYFEFNSSNKWLSRKLIKFLSSIETLLYEK